MPDPARISELPALDGVALPAPAPTDLLAVVSDPGGTPGTGQATLEQVFQADVQRPTADEKAALAGTEGVPSAANPFVTDADPRLSGGLVGDPVIVDGSLEVRPTSDAIGAVVFRTTAASHGTGFTFFYNATELGGFYQLNDDPTGLLFITKDGGPIRFVVGTSAVVPRLAILNNGVLVAARDAPTTGVGVSQHLELKDTQGNNGARIEIAFGYKATHFPALIGYVCTDGGGQTTGSLYFATRGGTANVAPTIRLTIAADGSVTIGGPLAWGGGAPIASSSDPALTGPPGAAGAAGHSVTVYDQPTEPMAAVAGDFWIS